MSMRIVRARNTDPLTSHLGAIDVAGRAPSQQMLLLLAFTRRPATDEEAAQLVKLDGIGYWKRCSELRTYAWIEPVKIGNATLTRTTTAGSQAMVCRITRDGREELRRRGLV